MNLTINLKIITINVLFIIYIYGDIMNPHAHMKGQSGVCIARHTVFDGIDLLFLDVQRETIQFFA